VKAIICTQYGSPDVLQLQEVEKPTPKDNEVLIKIRATPVNVGDVMVRAFNKYTPRTFTMPGPFWYITRLSLGIRKPRIKILGSEFSGEIEAVGKAVTVFKVGDAVFGYRGMKMGANAEYLCMPVNGLISHKPATMNWEEAACIPYGALTALGLLKRLNIQPGQKLLINGASGGIGSAAVQIAKHLGAEVTGVCGTPRLDYVKALGVDHVIDYTREDFTQNGETYDFIFDIMGKSSFERCKNSLKENGCYLLASFKLKQVFQMLRMARGGGKRVICALAMDNPADMPVIKDLAEAGKLRTIIDKRFPLEQTAEAHRYYESGDRKGVVLITV
jgi:NADPH:quinone reductase-like Zn-dependent oxidoreductase